MKLEDFKKGCEQWTREELLESLYNITKENERLNKQYDLMENSLDEKQEVIDKALEYIGSGKVKVMEYIEDFNTPIHTNWKLIEILKGDE